VGEGRGGRAGWWGAWGVLGSWSASAVWWGGGLRGVAGFWPGGGGGVGPGGRGVGGGRVVVLFSGFCQGGRWRGGVLGGGAERR